MKLIFAQDKLYCGGGAIIRASFLPCEDGDGLVVPVEIFSLFWLRAKECLLAIAAFATLTQLLSFLPE